MKSQFSRSAIVVLLSFTVLSACSKDGGSGGRPGQLTQTDGQLGGNAQRVDTNSGDKAVQDSANKTQPSVKGGAPEPKIDIVDTRPTPPPSRSTSKDSSGTTSSHDKSDPNGAKVRRISRPATVASTTTIRAPSPAPAPRAVTPPPQAVVGLPARSVAPAQAAVRPAPQAQASTPRVAVQVPSAASAPAPAAVPTPRPAVQTTTSTAPAAKPVVSQTAPVDQKPKRVFNIQFIYGSDAEKKLTAQQIDAVVQVGNKIDMANAVNTMFYPDDGYNTRVRSNPVTPIIPQSLFSALKNNNACELNTVGGCIVLEKDTVEGKTQIATYYVGSAEDMKVANLPRVARKDVDAKLNQVMTQAFKGNADGILVFSAAGSEAEAKTMKSQLVSIEEAIAKEESAGQTTLADNQKVTPVIVEEPSSTEQVADSAIDLKFEEDFKKDSGSRGFNRCSIVSTPKYGGGLKMVKRFFIADIVRTKKLPDGTKERVPTKIGKGKLRCALADGSKQNINIVIKDFQTIRLGLAFGKNSQYIYATGVGFANGGRDILTIKSFGYLIEADLQVFLGGFVLNPIILSRKLQGTAILSGLVGVVPQWTAPNINVAIGGWYEITVDPDDT